MERKFSRAKRVICFDDIPEKTEETIGKRDRLGCFAGQSDSCRLLIQTVQFPKTQIICAVVCLPTSFSGIVSIAKK